MNQRINSTNLEQALWSRASTRGHGSQQGAKVAIVAEVEENTTTSSIKMEMVTQILLKEGKTLLT